MYVWKLVVLSLRIRNNSRNAVKFYQPQNPASRFLSHYRFPLTWIITNTIRPRQNSIWIIAIIGDNDGSRFNCLSSRSNIWTLVDRRSKRICPGCLIGVEDEEKGVIAAR